MVFFTIPLANVTPVICDFINASKPIFVGVTEDLLEKYHNWYSFRLIQIITRIDEVVWK